MSSVLETQCLHYPLEVSRKNKRKSERRFSNSLNRALTSSVLDFAMSCHRFAFPTVLVSNQLADHETQAKRLEVNEAAASASRGTQHLIISLRHNQPSSMS